MDGDRMYVRVSEYGYASTVSDMIYEGVSTDRDISHVEVNENVRSNTRVQTYPAWQISVDLRPEYSMGIVFKGEGDEGVRKLSSESICLPAHDTV